MTAGIETTVRDNRLTWRDGVRRSEMFGRVHRLPRMEYASWKVMVRDLNWLLILEQSLYYYRLSHLHRDMSPRSVSGPQTICASGVLALRILDNSLDRVRQRKSCHRGGEK